MRNSGSYLTALLVLFFLAHPKQTLALKKDHPLDLTALENCGKANREIVYKTVAGIEIHLDLYYPKKKSSPYPLFYFIHGGGWYVGNKELAKNQQLIFDDLLRAGVACASINYRLVSQSTPEKPIEMRDCVTDAKDGLRFLKKYQDKYQLDMSRVVTHGTSAGGQISLLVTYSNAEDFWGEANLVDFPVSPVGCVSWFGPTDFTDSDLFVPHGMKAKLPPDRFTSRIMNGAPRIGYHQANDILKEKMREMSAVTYVKKSSPPVLQIHGNKDATIPHKHALQLKKKAKAVGAEVEVITVENAGHEFNFGGGHTPNLSVLILASVEYSLKWMGIEYPQ